MPYIKKLKITLVKGKYKNPINGSVKNAEHIFKIFQKIKDYSQETLIGVYLDNSLNVRSYAVLSVGTDDATIIDPTQIFEHAILLKSNIFILIHNHPSGNPIPSKSDLTTMQTIKKQAEVLNRIMLDFIIVGDDLSKNQKINYWSMFESYSDDKNYKQKN